MAYNLISADLDQSFLLPPDVREWLPADHLAWFVIEAVAGFDGAPFLARHRCDGRGGAAYDPMVMVAVLVYAYCVGECSSRRIERRLVEDVAFRVVGRNLGPDHATLARFRAAHEAALADLFGRVLELCATAGLVSAGLVAVDGTKMKAQASMAANRDEQGLRRALADEARRILDEAARVDAEEDERFGEARGDELPAEFADPATRAERIRAALDRLQAERDAVAAKEAAAEAARAAAGKRKPGRKPSPDRKPGVDRKRPHPQANMSDPDSRLMKVTGGFVQGYNAQVAVCETQVIIAAELTQDVNDTNQLIPLVQAATDNLAEAGVTETLGVLADAGYWAAANATSALAGELLIATGKARAMTKLVEPSQPPPEAPLAHPTRADRVADVEAVLRGQRRIIDVARRHGVLPPAVWDWVRIARAHGTDAIPAPRRKPHPHPPCINEADRARHAMQARLASPDGRALYKRRAAIVEPVFGQTKTTRGIDRFSRRGRQACAAEWKLIAATHNLLKLWRHNHATPAAAC